MLHCLRIIVCFSINLLLFNNHIFLVYNILVDGGMAISESSLYFCNIFIYIFWLLCSNSCTLFFFLMT